MRTVYIAHRLSAETRWQMEKNRGNASRWVGWLASNFPIAPIADWIILTGQWEETPENRARGLEIDCALVGLCDEMWMVGGVVSGGMRLESAHAKVVRDLTELGYAAPEGPKPLIREYVAGIVGMP